MALILGCEPQAHLAIPDDQPYDDVDAVAEDAAVPVPAPDDAAVTRDSADDAAAAVDAAAGHVSDASPIADASLPRTDASTPADGGANAADGAAHLPSDGGADALVPVTVVWSHHQVTPPSILGSITTEPYHRARFSVDVGGPSPCNMHVDSEFLATGTTGTWTISLDSLQQSCIRNSYDCSALAKVQWWSCKAPGCEAFSVGTVWETWRPVCSVAMPMGSLSLRLTVARIDPGGLDETWEIVTP